MDDREKFYRLANKAILNKLITKAERDLICRVGTRKVGYWSRHLRDLVEILNERIASRQRR